MSKLGVELLKHILIECNFINSVVWRLSSINQLVEDETLKRAVVRSLEVIGEALNKIPGELKDKMDSISWKSMSGMRNRLIHDYMGINYNIVWDVIRNKIPLLTEQIETELKRNA